MVVRLLDNGAFRVVTEESELRNHAVHDDSDTDKDDDDDVAGPVAPRPTTGLSPKGHDVPPTWNDARKSADFQSPGPVGSPAHGSMSPGQARHRHSRRSTGPSFSSPQARHPRQPGGEP